MNFKDIVTQRFATKKFDGKKIPEEKVRELLELVRLAPSSFNLQPWKIHIVTDPKIKEKLSAAAWNQAQITTCSHLLIFLADTNVNRLVDQLETQMKSEGVREDKRDPYVKMMRGFAAKMNPAQTLAWSQRQVYLALGNALNGAKSLGFDSCPMEGFDPAAVAKILDLPENLVPTALCPIGHASEKAAKKTRFSMEQILYE